MPEQTPTAGRPSKPSLTVRVFLSALLGLSLGSWSPWDSFNVNHVETTEATAAQTSIGSP
tara:strand:+ start:1005 stop:1184 length:180 start_codon:yes stop_codon:yes gene_type:complete